MRHILTLLLFFTSMVAYTQDTNATLSPTTLGGWADKLQRQARVLPQEAVFVHMDNNCYFKGDTVYYKAYVTRCDNARLTDLSRVLYIELLDHDGYLIERQILRLENGQAYGSFCLADTLYSGYYELRAYTRWQLNFGTFEHDHNKRTKYWFIDEECQQEYFRDYEKLYSRVFPVYDRPTQPGQYLPDMTLRPLRRYFRTREEKPVTELSFYPEGGNWVEGLPQHIAFEARSADGEHLDGTLVISDRKGHILQQANTEHRGRGSFTIAANSEDHYRAEFHWGNGHVANVKLPDMATEGVALHIAQDKGTLQVQVRACGAPAADSLGYTLLSGGLMKMHGAVTQESFTLPLHDLRSGVAQLTIYDRNGRVWADRLFFVRQPSLRQHNVAVTGLRDDYEPYDSITLGITAPHQATLSLVIRDKALSRPTHDNGTLLTEMLLASQIRGFVEQPGYYFEADDSLHNRHLDLLLMVQGWRRFSWHDLTHTFHIEHPIERQRLLSGRVYKTRQVSKMPFSPDGSDSVGSELDNAMEEMSSQAIILSNRLSGPILTNGLPHYYHFEPYTNESSGLIYDNEQLHLNPGQNMTSSLTVHAEFQREAGEPGIEGESLTSDRKFTIPIPSFDQYCYLHLAVADSAMLRKMARSYTERKADKKQRGRKLLRKMGKKYQWISPDNEEKLDNVPLYYAKLDFPYPRFVKPYDFYQTHEVEASSAAKGPLMIGDVTQMREVTVKHRHGGLRGFDRMSPAFKLDAHDALNAIVDAGMHLPTIYTENLFRLAVAANYIGEMGNEYRGYTMEPRWDYYGLSARITPATRFLYRQLCCLDSIYIYTDYSPRKEGDRRYSQSDQPSVTVDLHLIPGNGRRMAFRDRFYKLSGYNICEDFYQPQYHQRPLPDAPQDYRRTLYWNPNLHLDAEGHATITFWNNSRHNELSIEAEGICLDGTILTRTE